MHKRVGSVFRLFVLAAMLIAALWLGSVASENAAVQELLTAGGYLGVFLFSLINGFNVFVPIVTASFVPALSAAGLDAGGVIFVMTLGMTAADSAVFFMARAGRTHISKEARHVADSLVLAGERRHWLPLAILALWAFAAPLPNEVILVPLGLLGYRAYRVLPLIAAGNMAFNLVIGFGFIDLAAFF